MLPVVMLLITVLIRTVCAGADTNDDLCSSSCGNIKIASPFRLTTDPLSCGDVRYNLSCENSLTVLYLPVGDNHRYFVQAINYDNYTIRLVDSDIQKDDPCFSGLIQGLSTRETYNGLNYETEIRRGLESTNIDIELMRFKEIQELSKNVIFFNCERPVLDYSYIDAAPCVFKNSFLGPRIVQSRKQFYSYYYVFEGSFALYEFKESCRVVQMALIKNTGNNNRINSSEDVRNALAHGFELSWLQSLAHTDDYLCYLEDKDTNRVRCVSICVLPDKGQVLNQCDNFRIILGYLNLFLYHREGYKYIVAFLAPRVALAILLIGFVIYKWRRQHLSMYDGIEAFLRSQNNLMPIQYSYHEIKKMTNGFKDKLGEGGFGCVYRGKLRSGHLVAIKMLSKSKASGEDFMSEVATIGRIHHVNVVRLIGFSVEGLKRALVYEFMPNGSLDKYILSTDGKRNSLNAMELFEISLGIARGIEYLHQGCDMQILHFDIKPHNILLDENFVPKVSDFGLARLCPLDKSMVSLTAARGTLGYMAPELYYKNIGGVSRKADVYSFGMLLMEMANRRRNLNAEAERSSQVYFPQWIYKKLSQGHDMEMENATEEESKTIKKMVIIALWCIQLKPCDRPSISKAIEMLEDEVETLEMPPKLYLYPQEDCEAEEAMEKSNAEESLEMSLISNSY